MELTKRKQPRFSRKVFLAAALLGMVASILVQWVYQKPPATPESPTQTYVAYMNAHAGEDHNALLVVVGRDGDKITVEDTTSYAPKWVGSAWELLTARQLETGDFDRAFAVVRSAPNAADRAGALHNILHVVRVSPRALLPVFGANGDGAVPFAASAAAPVSRADSPTVGNFKPQTENLAIHQIPADHREWVALTIQRLKTAEAILAGLEPLPAVYSAWLDIEYNYEMLQQWASASAAKRAAIRVLVAYDRSQYWQEFRATYAWPVVISFLSMIGAGIGGLLLDYFVKALRFYSARGLNVVIRDKELRKQLGLIRRHANSTPTVQEGEPLATREGVKAR